MSSLIDGSSVRNGQAAGPPRLLTQLPAMPSGWRNVLKQWMQRMTVKRSCCYYVDSLRTKSSRSSPTPQLGFGHCKCQGGNKCEVTLRRCGCGRSEEHTSELQSLRH